MKIKGGYGYGSCGRILIRCVCGPNAFSCFLRTFLLLFLLTFVWVQVTFGGLNWYKMQLSGKTEIKNENANHENDPQDDGELDKQLENDKVEIINKNDDKLDKINEEEINDKVDTINKHDNKVKKINNNEINDKVEIINEKEISGQNTIKDKMKQYNDKQNVLNEEIHGPLTNDSLVIVVQVHSRIIYLKYLIESLAKAKYINDVLLIFSHDVYEENMNQLIQNIAFCKVMQIFLPFSVQANPNVFPGNDPNDCPRDVGKKRALELECLGAEHPDKYGHYRESQFTQIKHHWWWKANRVFNSLRITKSYTGLVTFLEEDHYVTEDFIYMLKMMSQKCSEIANCYFLGLGPHVNLDAYRKFKGADEVKMSSLTTNLGLTFNRTTFSKILNCSKQFCEYDDYNWDWSLNYIAQTCHNTILRSMITGGPRVFHTGECGTHIHKKDCKKDTIILKIQELLASDQNKLYPSSIRIIDQPAGRTKITENGGWGDTRDHQLCINMTRR